MNHDEAIEFLKETYKSLRDNGDVTVSLLITEKCNFECEHCFYGAGPRLLAKYISDDTLYQVKELIWKLNEMHLNVSINLVGGEPTLNLNEFERVFRWAENMFNYPEVGLQMTTNGWWLEKAVTTIRFLKIVGQMARSCPSGIEDGFSVRISNDIFHLPFRRAQRTEYVKQLIDELIESGSINDEPVTWKETTYCNDCGETSTGYQDECPECQSEDVEHETEDGEVSIPYPDNREAYWLYTEEWKSWDNVVPSGIRGQQGRNDHQCGKDGWTMADDIGINPDGTTSDGCCKGSLMPFGTVEDHPLVILALQRLFTFDRKPTCRECRTLAADFAVTDLDDYKTALYEALPDFLECGENTDWEEEMECTPMGVEEE